MANKEEEEVVITTRFNKWGLRPVSCELCGDDLGYAEGLPFVWCAHCALQEENEEDL